MKRLTPDDTATQQAIDALLDATDTTLDKMWRYKSLGKTLGQIHADLPDKRNVSINLRGEEVAIIKAAATEAGLTSAGYLRTCLARCILADHPDMTGADLPSFFAELARLQRD